MDSCSWWRVSASASPPVASHRHVAAVGPGTAVAASPNRSDTSPVVSRPQAPPPEDASPEPADADVAVPPSPVPGSSSSLQAARTISMVARAACATHLIITRTQWHPGVPAGAAGSPQWEAHDLLQLGQCDV